MDETRDETSPVQDQNFVFLTPDRLRITAEYIRNQKEPWASAYLALVDDANSALTNRLRSVVDSPAPDGDDPHLFYIQEIEHDQNAAIKMGRWARDCALVYWFTDNDKYAEQVIDIIHHWCLNPETYMQPTSASIGKAVTIEQHVALPLFMYAASFVREHPGWNRFSGYRPWDGGDSGDAEIAFSQWVEDRHDTFVQSRPDFCEYNNKWAWRIADRAVSAAYLRDDEKMEIAKCMWKGACATDCDDGSQTARPWSDFVNNVKDSRAYSGSADPSTTGLFKSEINRDAAFSYTGFNLKALSMSLLVFEAYDGTDLFGFNAPTDTEVGSTLRKAFNWFAPYVEDASAWKWDADEHVTKREIEGVMAPFEIAYSHWGDFEETVKPPYDNVARPHYDTHLLGHVTLTHGIP